MLEEVDVDKPTRVMSADELVQQGRTAEALRVIAAQGTEWGLDTQRHLVGMLVGLDRTEEALEVLLGDLDSPDPAVVEELSQLLTRGQLDDAVWVAHLEWVKPDEPDDWDRLALAQLLLNHRRIDQALDLLQELSGTDDPALGERVATLLTTHSRTDDR